MKKTMIILILATHLSTFANPGYDMANAIMTVGSEVRSIGPTSYMVTILPFSLAYSFSGLLGATSQISSYNQELVLANKEAAADMVASGLDQSEDVGLNEAFKSFREQGLEASDIQIAILMVAASQTL